MLQRGNHPNSKIVVEAKGKTLIVKIEECEALAWAQRNLGVNMIEKNVEIKNALKEHLQDHWSRKDNKSWLPLRSKSQNDCNLKIDVALSLG